MSGRVKWKRRGLDYQGLFNVLHDHATGLEMRGDGTAVDKGVEKAADVERGDEERSSSLWRGIDGQRTVTGGARSCDAGTVILSRSDGLELIKTAFSSLNRHGW